MNAIAKVNAPTPLIPGPLGVGPGGPLPSPSPWTWYGSWIKWTGGVVVGNPTGGNLGPGTVNASAFFLNGAAFNLNNYLPLTGGIISGTLTVNGVTQLLGGLDQTTIDMGTF